MNRCKRVVLLLAMALVVSMAGAAERETHTAQGTSTPVTVIGADLGVALPDHTATPPGFAGVELVHSFGRALGALPSGLAPTLLHAQQCWSCVEGVHCIGNQQTGYDEPCSWFRKCWTCDPEDPECEPEGCDPDDPEQEECFCEEWQCLDSGSSCGSSLLALSGQIVIPELPVALTDFEGQPEYRAETLDGRTVYRRLCDEALVRVLRGIPGEVYGVARRDRIAIVL